MRLRAANSKGKAGLGLLDFSELSDFKITTTMKKLLPLLLFAWACTSTPPESGERRNLPSDTTPAVTPSSEAAYQEVEDTTTPKFSSVYAFLDSVKPYNPSVFECVARSPFHQNQQPLDAD